MSTEVLREEQDGPVRTLVLNRPDKRNALSPALVEALIAGIERAQSDAAVRVIVITGAGEQVFCAGGDIDPMAAASGPAAMHEGRRRFVVLLRVMRGSTKPIIARVAGHVAGGGMGLIAASDLALCADDVTFATPEIKIGLFPMMIMTVLARHIPPKPLMELMFTGEKITARRAVEIHLVNDAVPRAELDARVAALAERVAGHSAAVLRLGRQAFYSMDDMTVDAALDYLCNQLTVTTLTEDAAEGLMAFISRRPPVWKDR